MELVVGITGASGVILGLRLLQILREDPRIKLHLIISEPAKKIFELELGADCISEAQNLAHFSYSQDQLEAPIASGSHPFQGMVIVPCSMDTLSKIAAGICDDLITRAAGVALKEHRKLILVIRETPLHSIWIEHMLKLSNSGAIILPAMLGFYHKPQKVQDLVDYIVGKVLDQLGIQHGLFKRWGIQDEDI